jgi:hypothetical protein
LVIFNLIPCDLKGEFEKIDDDTATANVLSQTHARSSKGTSYSSSISWTVSFPGFLKISMTFFEWEAAMGGFQQHLHCWNIQEETAGGIACRKVQEGEYHTSTGNILIKSHNYFAVSGTGISLRHCLDLVMIVTHHLVYNWRIPFLSYEDHPPLTQESVPTYVDTIDWTKAAHTPLSGIWLQYSVQINLVGRHEN